MAVKEPNKWWNNPQAFPVKRLHIDLSQPPTLDEDGVAFNFDFLTDLRATEPKNNEIWFPVHAIFDMAEPYDVMTYLSQRNLGSNPNAVRTLGRLHKVVHVDTVIAFYEEKNKDIEKVLSIFIRTNSGGTILSYSDLLLSIATSEWQQLD